MISSRLWQQVAESYSPVAPIPTARFSLAATSSIRSLGCCMTSCGWHRVVQSRSWRTAPKWAPVFAPRCRWWWPMKWKPIGSMFRSSKPLVTVVTVIRTPTAQTAFAETLSVCVGSVQQRARSWNVPLQRYGVLMPVHVRPTITRWSMPRVAAA